MALHPTLLVDLGQLSCGCTNHALEGIYKALSDPPDGDGVWAPHHDPYVRGLIEQTTARGVRILGQIRAALIPPEPTMAKAEPPWLRWDRAAFEAFHRRLDGKRHEDFTLEDWLLLVEWAIQQYLPDGVIQTEAEYLAVKSAMAGRIQAATEGARLTHEQIAGLVAIAPATVVQLGQITDLGGLQAAQVHFARARAAEFIQDIGEHTRRRLANIIIDHQERRALGDKSATNWQLESAMSDEFMVLNRDWRRVALTEVARNANEGYILAQPKGAKVQRVEAYAGACPFCRKIDGMVFTVVDPGDPDRDGWKHVWAGKTNIGRSAAPRKREGDALVERTPDELWWPAAGTQHPHCRGTWRSVTPEAPPAGVDPEFNAWLEEQLAHV